ncbi:MAG: serine protease, partial [Planctomycetales bacterium]|nr:serine protease [Planctomycetales bacterium]
IASFGGRATIGATELLRPCQIASMAWPVRDAWGEIPMPRLLAEVPVSVGASEMAPISIVAAEDKVWEVAAGQLLKIPLKHIRREDFSGDIMGLRTFGTGFDKTPNFEVSLKADQSEAVLDLAKLKTPPGDYRIAFYGSAVAKYRYNPEAVIAAQFAQKLAQQEVAAATEATGPASADRKEAADAALATATKQLEEATKQAQPKDIVDIIVSEPIAIRVNAAETK